MGDNSALRSIERSFVASSPVRSLLRLLIPHRGRLSLATVAFLIKDSPAWLLPPITAAVIDIVVDRGPLPQLWLWAACALALLSLNYPFHMIFVRLSSRAIRSMAVDVRNALAERLQRLSIGFHNRQSASIVHTKVVRDVESIEMMMQQALPTFLSALCDERGLLTWQDFLLACAAYAEEAPLGHEIEAEARENVARLAAHPSLVVLNGNNENLWGFEEWNWKLRLDGK
ncbi:ABC transporter transmembrane domain-containing protein, partial [Cryobacterium zongtaii]|uniref:ABC transporter transmembrane domain-containing protein n=1 Tax=Cryobacterium zongtaii TaxID=1259217 RepID=UPI001FAFDB68